MILTIVISIFLILELGNVLILYFAPDSRMGNGVDSLDYDILLEATSDY